MKRAFTLVELLSVVVMLFIVAAALTQSVSKAGARARQAKAQAEMASIVADVQSAKDINEAVARYATGEVKDPWGNSYRVTVRRIARKSDGLSAGTTTIWYPNACSPRGGAQ